MFLNACWAVKRMCHYNFRLPLFSPLLHWYLLPVTPAITCSPQVLLVITLTSGVTYWDMCNQFSCILDLIKIRKATVFRNKKTLFEGHAPHAWLWDAFTFSLVFKSISGNVCLSKKKKILQISRNWQTIWYKWTSNGLPLAPWSCSTCQINQIESGHQWVMRWLRQPSQLTSSQGAWRCQPHKKNPRVHHLSLKDSLKRGEAVSSWFNIKPQPDWCICSSPAETGFRCRAKFTFTS